jgi:hypothetical protein
MRESNQWLCTQSRSLRGAGAGAEQPQQNRLFERDFSPGGLNVEVHIMCGVMLFVTVRVRSI